MADEQGGEPVLSSYKNLNNKNVRMTAGEERKITNPNRIKI